MAAADVDRALPPGPAADTSGRPPRARTSPLVSGARARRWLAWIPLIAPQIAISVVWMSYSTLTGLGVVRALTGGGPLRATQTLPMEMYFTAFTELEMNEALAIATFLLVLNALLTLLFVRVSRRYDVAS